MDLECGNSLGRSSWAVNAVLRYMRERERRFEPDDGKAVGLEVEI